MAGMAGLEPTNVAVKVRCLTAWLHPCVKRTARNINRRFYIKLDVRLIKHKADVQLKKWGG